MPITANDLTIICHHDNIASVCVTSPIAFPFKYGKTPLLQSLGHGKSMPSAMSVCLFRQTIVRHAENTTFSVRTNHKICIRHTTDTPLSSANFLGYYLYSQ